MTDIVPAGQQAMEQYSDDMSGLEDFDQSDMVMPTVKIDHPTGSFVDGLSNQTYKELDCVVLGLVKQRVLWHPDVDDSKDPPLCRSLDFQIGRPRVEVFPWEPSGFASAVGAPEEGMTLPCASCQLKDWGTHPKQDVPWCSEQHTYVVLMRTEDGDDVPGVVTFQRSGIKPSKTYLTSFARSKTPIFTVRTHIKLEMNKRGTVTYSVPKFTRGAATDQSEWAGYSENYRSIREFLQTPRVNVQEDDIDPAGTSVAVTPTAAPAPRVATPAAAPAPAAAPVVPPAAGTSGPVDDDDLPF